MCPSSWKLYLDDFFWFRSSSSRTQTRAVWSLGVRELMPLAMMMICRTFISHIFAFCLKTFLTIRPGTWNFVQVPDPSRPEVKKPYPSDPGRGSHFCRGRGGACIPGLFVALWEKVHFPRCGRFLTFRSWVMAIFVKKTWPTRQKVFPLPTVGALSASNSSSALSVQALRAGWVEWINQSLFNWRHTTIIGKKHSNPSYLFAFHIRVISLAPIDETSASSKLLKCHSLSLLRTTFTFETIFVILFMKQLSDINPATWPDIFK